MGQVQIYVARGVRGTTYSGEKHGRRSVWIVCDLCSWRSPNYEPVDRELLQTGLQAHANEEHKDIEMTVLYRLASTISSIGSRRAVLR